MCYVLPAEDVLLNYFAEKKKKDERVERISFGELGIISRRIVRECNNSILAPYSVEDIIFAARRRCGFIEIEDASVVLRDESFMRHMELYNCEMPETVRDICVQICKEHVSECQNF